MKQPRIVVMAGSRRREALSRRVAQACAQAVREAGAELGRNRDDVGGLLVERQRHEDGTFVRHGG